MDKLLWRIYYEDGTTFSNLDGSFKDAPFWGVSQIICEPDIVLGVDREGLLDYLMRLGIVKLGREMGNARFHELHGRANLEADIELSPDREICEGKDYYVWVKAINDH